MLDKEFEYFKSNQSKLFEKYPDKFLVIKDLEVKYVASTFEKALQHASKNYELGTFIIQHCTRDAEGYTQTFHSRVIFA